MPIVQLIFQWWFFIANCEITRGYIGVFHFSPKKRSGTSNLLQFRRIWVVKFAPLLIVVCLSSSCRQTSLETWPRQMPKRSAGLKQKSRRQLVIVILTQSYIHNAFCIYSVCIYIHVHVYVWYCILTVIYIYTHTYWLYYDVCGIYIYNVLCYWARPQNTPIPLAGRRPTGCLCGDGEGRARVAARGPGRWMAEDFPCGTSVHVPKCKCVPTFPEARRGGQREKERRSSTRTWVQEMVFMWQLNIYPTFCSFWHFLDFRRKPNFLKRRFWMDHPGWILSTR